MELGELGHPYSIRSISAPLPCHHVGPLRWPVSLGLLNRHSYRDSSLLAGLSESSKLKNSAVMLSTLLPKVLERSPSGQS